MDELVAAMQEIKDVLQTMLNNIQQWQVSAMIEQIGRIQYKQLQEFEKWTIGFAAMMTAQQTIATEMTEVRERLNNIMILLNQIKGILQEKL